MTKREEINEMRCPRQKGVKASKTFLHQMGDPAWAYWLIRHERKEWADEPAPIGIGHTQQYAAYSFADDSVATSTGLPLSNSHRTHGDIGTDDLLTELSHESLTPYVLP